MSQRVRAGGASWLPRPGVYRGAGTRQRVHVQGWRGEHRLGLACGARAGTCAGLTVDAGVSRHPGSQAGTRAGPAALAYKFLPADLAASDVSPSSRPGVQVPAPRVAVAWYDERRQEP